VESKLLESKGFIVDCGDSQNNYSYIPSLKDSLLFIFNSQVLGQKVEDVVRDENVRKSL
jgi:hypothetical protein